MALIRAEAPGQTAPLNFLKAAAATLPTDSSVEVLGPYPSPMERRAGRYRAQLMLQANQRGTLQALLTDWLPGVSALPMARRVRWSVDVDPAEML
jgi:primosomal protein N' (replication factor Y)